ncbi:hypothetical protein A6P39_013535 [Streptomyces sp. FXJ1.172]|uniref:hypothetical protein n=1 Tax=Streptomyces sp. FXJ1.172 TaxID=710705 RepID=UPI0007CF8351|nr:hypothetical protein [Streptomyces sp. FXJ1.172]WEO94952.1 hypothetical protein A6P39_013535 [Streptomyces sp. FXJ1.172]
MPYPPPRTPSGPRRRSLLASAAGAALLAGCTSGPDSADAGTSSVTSRARARAARDSQALLARYDAVIASHPGLAGRLHPLRAQVAEHVRAFTDGTAPTAAQSSASPPSPASSTSPTPPPSSASSASPASTTPPASPSATASAAATERDALAALAAAERALADRRTRALPAVPGELARLLASVAAAGAAHAYLLTAKGAK